MSSSVTPTLATTSPTDLALVRAIRAFSGSGRDGGSGDPFGLLAKFAPEAQNRLHEVWFSIARVTPEIAWQTLLRDHQAAARFDPARVHPSWFERILAAESPAVQSLVTARATGRIREALDRRRSAAEIEGRAVDSAHPEAVAWALTLWTERLVGDLAESPDDPPVILALSQFSLRDQLRLVKALGQAKLAFAIDNLGPDPTVEALARCSATDRVRIAFFRRIIGEPDSRLIPLARADFGSVAADPRWKFAAVGLLTVARLLKGFDPHRVRWAVQHIPYPIARRFGKLAGSQKSSATTLPFRAVQVWEAWIMEAAWARLLSEGRFGSEGGRIPT